MDKSLEKAAATEAYTADKNLDTAEELYRAFYHLPPKR